MLLYKDYLLRILYDIWVCLTHTHQKHLKEVINYWPNSHILCKILREIQKIILFLVFRVGHQGVMGVDFSHCTVWELVSKSRKRKISTFIFSNFWFIFKKYITINLENHLCFVRKKLFGPPRQLNHLDKAQIIVNFWWS